MSTYVLSELKGTQLEVFKVGRHRIVSTQTSVAIERKHGGTLLEVSPGQLTINSHNFYWGVRPPSSAATGDIVWNTASLSDVLCWQWDGEQWQEYQRYVAPEVNLTDSLFIEEDDHWIVSSDLLIPAAQVQVSNARQFVTEQQLSVINNFKPETKTTLLNKLGKATKTNSGYLTSNDYSKFLTAYEVSQELLNNPETVSIPTKLSEFANDQGFITSADIPVNLSSFNNDVDYVTTAELADALSSLPETESLTITHLSQLINDAGYLTEEDLNALSLASLSDVQFPQYPADKDVLAFSLQNQTWTSKPLPVPSLEDLKDVTTLGKKDKNYLGYNRSSRRWEPMALPESTAITSINSELVLELLSSAELDSLSDVTIANLKQNDVLTYKDGAWRNVTLQTSTVTLDSIENVEIGKNLKPYTLLVYKDSVWQTIPLSELPNVASASSNLSGLEIANLQDGHILQYSSNTNTWRNVPLPASIAIDLATLPSVSLQAPFKSGQALIYDADNKVWRNQEVSQFTVEGLSNTIIVEPKLDDVLAYQPSTRSWVNKKIQSVSSSSSVENLNDLKDVAITQTSTLPSGYVLSFDAIGKRWIASNPKDIFTADIDLSSLTTDVIPEGEVNYYFTRARFIESLESLIGQYSLDLFFTSEYLENASYGYIPVYTNPGWAIASPSSLQLRTSDLLDVDNAVPEAGDIFNFDGSQWRPIKIKDLYSPVLSGPPEYITFEANAASDSYGMIYWCGTSGYSKPYETPTGAAAPFDVICSFAYINDLLIPVEDYIVPAVNDAYNVIDRDPLTSFQLAGVAPKFYVDLGQEKRIKLKALHFAGSLLGSGAGAAFKVWGVAPEYPNDNGDVTLDVLAYIDPSQNPPALGPWALIDDVYVLSLDVNKAYRYLGIEGVAADFSEDFITLTLDYFELYGYAVLPANEAFTEALYSSHSNYDEADYSSNLGGSPTGSSGSTPLPTNTQTLPGGSQSNTGSSPVNSGLLRNLGDVDITLPQEGDTLLYDAANSVWVNTAVALPIWGEITGDLADQTDLQAALDDKVDTALLGAPSGVATLNSLGLILASQLPPIAISDTYVVINEIQMLALVAQIGDIAVRTDLNKSFILQSLPASTVGNWIELLTSSDTVLSVNGATGAVVLTTSDIAEGSNLYYTNARVASYLTTSASNVITTTAIQNGAVTLSKLSNIPNQTFLGNISGASAAPAVLSFGAGFTFDGTTVNTVSANDFFLNDLADVDLTTPPTTGAVLGYDSISGQWEPITISSVISVNGLDGVVTLTTNNIAEGSNLYYTNSRVDTRIGQTTIDALADVIKTGWAENKVWGFNAAGNTVPLDLAAIGGISFADLVDVSITAPVDGATIVWDQTTGKFIDGPVVSLTDTDDLPEGGYNLYYTTSRVDTRVSQLSIDQLADVNISGWATGEVLGFNSSGMLVPLAVVLPATTDDLPQGSTNKYYSNALVSTWAGTTSIDVFQDVNTTGWTTGQVLGFNASGILVPVDVLTTATTTDSIPAGVNSARQYYSNAQVESYLDTIGLDKIGGIGGVGGAAPEGGQALIYNQATQRYEPGSASVISIVQNFNSTGDQNGLVYWCGSAARKQPFSNPANRQAPYTLTVTLSSNPSSGATSAAIDRNNNTLIQTASESNARFILDFGNDKLVRPNHYTIRGRNDTDTKHPRSWKLQGSMDGLTNWVDLDTRTNNTAINQGTWFSGSCTAPSSFRYLSILLTGFDSSGVTSNLTFSEFEVYGDITVAGAEPIESTDDLPEGSSNLYFTNARVQSYLTSGASLNGSAIVDNSVTLAKLPQLNQNQLLGRYSSGTGTIETITLGTGLSLSGSTLNVSIAGGVTSVVGQTGGVTAVQIATGLNALTGTDRVSYNSLKDAPATFSSSWGSITGTLSAQTDLQAALNAKYNTPAGTISQYVRGDGSIAAFPNVASSWGTITGTLSAQADLQSALNNKYDNPTGDTTEYVRGDGSISEFPEIITAPGLGIDFGEWDESPTFDGGVSFDGVAGKLIIPVTTTAIREANIPKIAELVYDSDTGKLYYGDGVTPGGKRLGDISLAVEGINSAGNSKYYGTNASGTTGFHSLPDLQRRNNTESVSATKTLTLSAEYFQFLNPTVATVIVKLPAVTGSSYFECEIANTSLTNALVIQENDGTAITTLANTGDKVRSLYAYWDGATWQVWFRGYY